ncbi:MAG: hypothetical protein KGK04_12660 [Xanthomonadaceae bacterium]|nr:hypothetical protein [Xanthomonadaceae bacterium]
MARNQGASKSRRHDIQLPDTPNDASLPDRIIYAEMTCMARCFDHAAFMWIDPAEPQL